MKTLQNHQQSLLLVLFLILCAVSGIREYSRQAARDSQVFYGEARTLP